MTPDNLRRLWNLSQHDKMVIWIAGEIQRIVMDELGVDTPIEAEDALSRRKPS